MKTSFTLFFLLIFNLNILSMNDKFYSQQLCLHTAIKDQDFIRIDSILDNDAFDINKQDAQVKTL